jgi:hypothetical protein
VASVIVLDGRLVGVEGLEPMLLLFLMLATSCPVSWLQTGEVRDASTVTNSLSTIIST